MVRRLWVRRITATAVVASRDTSGDGARHHAVLANTGSTTLRDRSTATADVEATRNRDVDLIDAADLPAVPGFSLSSPADVPDRTPRPAIARSSAPAQHRLAGTVSSGPLQSVGAAVLRWPPVRRGAATATDTRRGRFQRTQRGSRPRAKRAVSSVAQIVAQAADHLAENGGSRHFGIS